MEFDGAGRVIVGSTMSKVLSSSSESSSEESESYWRLGRLSSESVSSSVT